MFVLMLTSTLVSDIPKPERFDYVQGTYKAVNLKFSFIFSANLATESFLSKYQNSIVGFSTSHLSSHFEQARVSWSG